MSHTLHTLRSLTLLSFVGLIVGALWLFACASADPGPIVFRAQPLATGYMLEPAHADPYLPTRPAPAPVRPQIF